MRFIAQLFVHVIFLSGSSSQHTHYVVPVESSHSDCPALCSTLDHYMEQNDSLFTGNATFIFLPGNYSLQRPIRLINISGISFFGPLNESEPKAVIHYGNGDALQCVNVTNFQMQKLVFVRDIAPITNISSSSALNIVQSRNVSIVGSIFKGSEISSHLNVTYGPLRVENNSQVKISDCLFGNNSALYGGGLAALGGSDVTFDGTMFVANQAALGGALYAENSTIILTDSLGNTFAHNVAWKNGGAIYCTFCVINFVGGDSRNANVRTSTFCPENVVIESHHIYFINNSAVWLGGAVAIERPSRLTSSVSFLHFSDNRVRDFGGAIGAQDGVSISLGIAINTTQFFANNRGKFGGAIYYVSGSSLTIDGNTFFTNNSGVNGGVMNTVLAENLIVRGRTFFTGNSAENGGALHLGVGTKIFFVGDVTYFRNNSASMMGGAILTVWSQLVLAAGESYIIDNYAHTGGGIACNLLSHFVAESGKLIFSGNFAQELGAAILSSHSVTHRVNSAVFTNNGASNVVFILFERGTVFSNITATGNAGGFMLMRYSHANITGCTVIKGSLSYGMSLQYSTLFLHGYTEFNSNKDIVGAAIKMFYQSELYIYGETCFLNNTADKGGAIYALESSIHLIGTANFTSNMARNQGGAMYMYQSKLNFEPNSSLLLSRNRASLYGGGIYNSDIITPYQCKYKRNLSLPVYVATANVLLDSASLFLPQCFIHLEGFAENPLSSFSNTLSSFTMISHQDSAGLDGNVIYGGQLDRCRVSEIYQSLTLYETINDIIFQIDPAENNNTAITSQPYELCFCGSYQESNCSDVISIEVYRGQVFTLPLIAYAQGGNSVSTQVTAKIKKTAALDLNQNTQLLSKSCSTKSYNLYSTESTEEMVLYIDGPCRDTGVATVTVNVVLRPCPDGFNLTNDRCECEERLQAFSVECTILSEDTIFIKKISPSLVLFWVNKLYDNGSYQGLVLYDRCPPEFCMTRSVEILLDDLDSQCNHNRSGKLCGACAANYSLLLGNSRCQKCSDKYLGILLVFASAGLLLVAFLTLLRLTVATGLINSIILYANIVQVNKSVFFFPVDSTNVLSMFIAWMNLDFGYPVCFYNGMDAYAQTWLQFVFPVYIWIIISLIILVSRYSIIMSRLIGHNPIAVLATLILMSYTKILKIIIEVYSFVELDYPGNIKVRVWLKDANVPYLEAKHLFLTGTTTLILVLIFLPYTAFLLFGYKFYRFCVRKQFSWLLKIKPFLESYYGPYSVSTRYWTGFLLLIRCILYIVFSFNSLGGTSRSLLAIIITFTVIVVIILVHAWHSVKIYKCILPCIIETAVHVNLIVLSAICLANINSLPVKYSLIGCVFIVMLGIIVHSFHITYTARSAKWHRIKKKVLSLVYKLKAHIFNKKAITASQCDSAAAIAAATSSRDPHTIPTQSVIEFREVLLEDL